MENSDIEKTLLGMRNSEQAKHLSRFFKTGKGEYGEGDLFLGIRVPQTRRVVKDYRFSLSLDEISGLLSSEWHEIRLAGFLLLVEEMKAAVPGKKHQLTDMADRREELARFYIRNAEKANNWDLVDLTCQYILGPWLSYPDRNGNPLARSILLDLSESNNLWTQRISIVTTLYFIRNGEFEEALELSRLLLKHPHDLIHKAVGWILREVGKRDIELLRNFLDDHFSEMARTTLRYAIEKMSPQERACWLKRE